jgi:hypothetical protein
MLAVTCLLAGANIGVMLFLAATNSAMRSVEDVRRLGRRRQRPEGGFVVVQPDPGQTQPPP